MSAINVILDILDLIVKNHAQLTIVISAMLTILIIAQNVCLDIQLIH